VVTQDTRLRTTGGLAQAGGRGSSETLWVFSPFVARGNLCEPPACRQAARALSASGGQRSGLMK